MTPEQEREILDAVADFIQQHKVRQLQEIPESTHLTVHLQPGMDAKALLRIKRLVDEGIYNEG